MPATHPIYRDEYGTVAKPIAATTLEQRVQIAQRGRRFPQRPLQSNSLGDGLAGYRVRRAAALRGGGFALRATSGMKTA